MSTASWLRELGAFRVMADEDSMLILVLGRHSTEGTWPVKWLRHECPHTIKTESGRVVIPTTELWFVHGIMTARPLTREDCERILRAVEGEE